ncbi:MAG: ferredoxin [bacterium]
MEVTVDEALCTGCSLCEQTVPDVFEMADDMAKVKVDVVPADKEEDVKEAADSCPAEAIKISE